jgi:ankyrin repeat protein
MAAFFGHPKNAQALIDGGALLDARHLAFARDAETRGPNSGSTPLKFAGHQGHLKVMKVLLEAGASVDEGMMDSAYWGTVKHDPEVTSEVVRLVSSYAIRQSIRDAMSTDDLPTGVQGRLSPADPNPL